MEQKQVNKDGDRNKGNLKYLEPKAYLSKKKDYITLILPRAKGIRVWQHWLLPPHGGAFF
jgi:hypothetical protein